MSVCLFVCARALNEANRKQLVEKITMSIQMIMTGGHLLRNTGVYLLLDTNVWDTQMNDTFTLMAATALLVGRFT